MEDIPEYSHRQLRGVPQDNVISFTEFVTTHCKLHLLRDNVRTWNWTTCQGYQTAIISMKNTEEDCKIPNWVLQLTVVEDLEWLDVNWEYRIVLTLLHIIASLKLIRTTMLGDGAKIRRWVGIKCQLAHGLKLDGQAEMIRSEYRSFAELLLGNPQRPLLAVQGGESQRSAKQMV